MLDVRDGWLLRAAQKSDDTSVCFRRFRGNGRANVICFLPWLTPFRLAAGMGIVPKDFLACYEMPSALVSSEPELCVEALRRVAADAERVALERTDKNQPLIAIGWSLGSAPATYFANKVGATLCSIGSADRGDLMLWESPAAEPIKERAVRKGFALADFTAASHGWHPAENLHNIGTNSAFALGLRDKCVPAQRRHALMSAVTHAVPGAVIHHIDAGHVRTLIKGTAMLARLRAENSR
jgi:hypothetical protein